MKTWQIALYSCLVIFITDLSITNANESLKSANQPYYKLKFNQSEFTVFNRAVCDGLNKYGGNAVFDLEVKREQDDIVWIATIENKRLMEVLHYWVYERGLKLIKDIDPEKLDQNQRVEVAIIKSLSDKIDVSKGNPIWDEVSLSGILLKERDGLFLKGEKGRYHITGNHIDEMESLDGKQVVVHGFIKVKDQIEVIRALEKRENTLELFVMSQCPFGTAAEAALIPFIENLDEKTKPILDIRYIFYKKADRFTALHGEPEMIENLVQMVIRDDYPEFYHAYLLERNEDKEKDWKQLGKDVGMGKRGIKDIERKISKEREKRIQAEYDYVAGKHHIYDISPTFVWESERVADIRDIDLFRDLTISGKGCQASTN